MKVIARISWYVERSVVTLKLRKEYLNTLTRNAPILLRIKYWTVWYIDRYSMSTYTGVSNLQKTVRFFGPPCICVLLRWEALHTTNGTQPDFAKRDKVNGAAASQIRWRRIVNVNDTIKIRSLVFQGPGLQKHFKLAMASCQAAFGGNT